MRSNESQLAAILRVGLLVSLILTASSCTNMTRIDYSKFSRAGWQRPDRVLEGLALSPGDRVADLGSGHGFFLPFLSAAVGPKGRVFAVDVDPDRVAGLEKRVSEEALGNVEIILGDFDDSRLPEGGVNLVLIVNTYHHIQDRPQYFRALSHKLTPGGRVAIIEPNEDLKGILGLFVDDDHASRSANIHTEMRKAGFRHVKAIDSLPVQLFEIWY